MPAEYITTLGSPKQLPELLNGEFLLHDTIIIWSHKLSEDTDEENYLTNYDDDESLSFETTTDEELLQEGYQHDYNKLQEFLDNIEQTDNWSYSDSEVIDDVIVFKIF